MGLGDLLDDHIDWCNDRGIDPFYSPTYVSGATSIRNTLSDVGMTAKIHRVMHDVVFTTPKKEPVRFTQILELYGSFFDSSVSESIKNLERHRLEYKIYISKIEHFYFNIQSNVIKNIVKLIHDDTVKLIQEIETYYAENGIYFDETDSAKLVNLDFVSQSKATLTKIIFEYVASHLIYASHNNTKSIDKILTDCGNISDYLTDDETSSRATLLNNFKKALRIDKYSKCSHCGAQYLKVLNYCFECCERND